MPKTQKPLVDDKGRFLCARCHGEAGMGVPIGKARHREVYCYKCARDYGKELRK